MFVREASIGTTPWSVMTARFSSSLAISAMAAQTLANTSISFDFNSDTISSKPPTKFLTVSPESLNFGNTLTFDLTKNDLKIIYFNVFDTGTNGPGGRCLHFGIVVFKQWPQESHTIHSLNNPINRFIVLSSWILCLLKGIVFTKYCQNPGRTEQELYTCLPAADCWCRWADWPVARLRLPCALTPDCRLLAHIRPMHQQHLLTLLQWDHSAAALAIRLSWGPWIL